ncbi:MAG TPA: VOC family protein, partial [Candidatus Acidoferrales bacterium]|nr:VOC family protein [Candidatus Acidoferrales bacterium]
IGAIIATVAAVIAISSVVAARPHARAASPDSGDPLVKGMAFDGHQVSNLDNTIKYYEQIDFHVKSKTGWHVDKVLNKLGNTPGAESRQAVMETLSSVSDKPFDITFTEYRGIDRKNWSSLGLGDLLSGHLDLTVMDDCKIDIEKLKAIGMLKEVSLNMPGQGGTNGPMRFAFVQDPDGWFVEFFAIMKPAPGAPPEAPKVSNSSATMQNIERLGKQIGFNHIGLDVKDMAKAVGFYQGVLGGDYPPLAPPEPPPTVSVEASPGAAAGGAGRPGGGRAAPRMNMMNGWFPQAGTDKNVRLELIGEPGTTVPDEHFADINVNYVAFQVTDIDAVYAKAKEAGVITVTDGGVMKVKDGRAVIIRDPDVGGFVELWQPNK